MSIFGHGFADMDICREWIELQMDDQCVITRDLGGTFDDVLDQSTGQLVPGQAGQEPVYSGMCEVEPLAPDVNQQLRGGHLESLKQFKVLIPKAVTDVRVGDQFMTTVSDNDPSLVGRPMRVQDVERSTHRVYRRLTCEDFTDAVLYED